MYTYTTRYQYRKTPQTSNKVKYIKWGVIFLAIAILVNIIVELPLYQHIIIALS